MTPIERAIRSAEKAQQLADKGPERWKDVCAHLGDVRRALVEVKKADEARVAISCARIKLLAAARLWRDTQLGSAEMRQFRAYSHRDLLDAIDEYHQATYDSGVAHLVEQLKEQRKQREADSE